MHTLNSNEIQKIIPHRHPMLLIDTVKELVPGKKAISTKAVTANEWFFVGHFPSEHVMPGVLIVESLAQTGAVAILSLQENKGKLVYFAGIEKLRFKRKVIPGDVLTLKVEIIKQRGPLGIGSAEALVNDEVAVVGEIMFAL